MFVPTDLIPSDILSKCISNRYTYTSCRSGYKVNINTETECFNAVSTSYQDEYWNFCPFREVFGYGYELLQYISILQYNSEIVRYQLFSSTGLSFLQGYIWLPLLQVWLGSSIGVSSSGQRRYIYEVYMYTWKYSIAPLTTTTEMLKTDKTLIVL